MTPEQLIKHYGSDAMAAASIGKSLTCVKTWIENKKIPLWSQFAIQTITKGALKASRAKEEK